MSETPENPHPEADFNKEEFDTLIKESLEQAKGISDSYKKFFTSDEGKESMISEVENRLEKVKEKYEHLFSTDEAGQSRISELNIKIDEIKKYHTELLSGENSIQADINESQEKITDFYVSLFGNAENPGGQEQKLKNAIDSIVNFHEDLTKEGGYDKTIEQAHKEIIAARDDLFLEDEEGNSKISSLNKDVEYIKTFRDSLETEIQPFIQESKDDIEAKRKDAAALLRQATGGALVDGFLESKQEYSGRPRYKKLDSSRMRNFGFVCSNVGAYFYSLMVLIFDYVLFILPLLLSVMIFTRPDMIANITGSGGNALSEYLVGLNFYGRLIISLPLWWISWFGQRSISHKRRLAEEYNHKAQVTTMYLNFVSGDTEKSYPLEASSKAELHNELIKVIARHPGQVYGKDETILDKVIELISAGRGAKKDIPKNE